jgi:hypothetical protein
MPGSRPGNWSSDEFGKFDKPETDEDYRHRMKMNLLGLAVTVVLMGVVIWFGAGMMTGGLLGGFLGAMLTRGVEKEVANFYDQEVTDGNLLVAVECHRPDAEVLLAGAEHILSEAGAEPLPLPEG